MKVLVTGGTGMVGRSAVRHLVEQGHTLRVIGRTPGLTIEGAEYRQCDITDYDSLATVTRGMEGVVHLAAIPNPQSGSGHEIFRVNCGGTYNVFAAAAAAGIRRVVVASSINALGATFGIKPIPVKYFPIDEEHPTFTTDPYSFSKGVIEEIAAYFWRREGISSVCLRLPAVRQTEWQGYSGPWLDRPASELRAAFEELAATPKETRDQWQENLRRQIEEWRKQRHDHTHRHHRRHVHHWGHEQPPTAQRLLHHLYYGRTDFWTLVDEMDSARAIELGLTAAFEGSHPLFINDNRNSVGAEAEVLAQMFFPEVTERKRSLHGDDTLVSTERARKLIGFVPRHPIPQLLGERQATQR